MIIIFLFLSILFILIYIKFQEIQNGSYIIPLRLLLPLALSCLFSLFMVMIFVQNLSMADKIKSQLILKNPKITKEEILKLEQDYAVYTNSITDGVLIKIFSISKDYKPINNFNN
jgi:hypothetical protein